MGSAEKLPELISEFGKVAGYQINMQKSILFLYASNKNLDIEIKNHCHLQQHKKSA